MSEFKFSPIDILFTWFYYHFIHYFIMTFSLPGEYVADRFLSTWTDKVIVEVIARDFGGVLKYLSSWGETTFKIFLPSITLVIILILWIARIRGQNSKPHAMKFFLSSMLFTLLFILIGGFIGIIWPETVYGFNGIPIGATISFIVVYAINKFKFWFSLSEFTSKYISAILIFIFILDVYYNS
tara:strand:+ start:199 stop:747 length:549 start_codon:yes stop_codon:yes gene_type:complete